MNSTLAQEELSQFFIELSGYNNGTFLPGKGALGIWSRDFHPGIRLGTRYYYKDTPKSQWFQAVYFSYFYHANAQHGIQFYTDFGYRYKILPTLSAEGSLGFGYLRSIPDMDIFIFKNSTYELLKPKGRNQWMGTSSLKIAYDVESQLPIPLEVYLAYQFWVQSPFVNKYVPVLPNNSVHLGVIYYWNKPLNKD